MSTCNIPSSIEDPNYRYTMPRVKAKIEGRGNGIKTNIMNMGDIARALKRPPEYPTKFCGCELGSQSKFEPAEGKAIVNGAHTEADLQQIIDKFVERFVLCPGCHLPEIDLAVAKGRVRGLCNACGFQGDLDNAHKLATYILKNPPAGVDSTMGKKAKKSKEEKRAEKVAKSRGLGSHDDEDDEEAAREGEEKHKAHKHKHGKHHKKDKEGGSEDGAEGAVKKEKKHHKTSKSKKEDEEVEGEGAHEGDRHHHHKKKKEKGSTSSKGDESPKGAGKLDLSDNEEEPMAGEKALDKEVLTYESGEIMDVIRRLQAYLEKEQRVSGSAFFQEVRLLQVAQDFDSTMRVYVALAGLYPGSLLTVVGFKERVGLLHAVCDRSVKGDMVLTAFEAYLAHVATESYPHYAKLCSVLYDEDLVDEDDFLSHYDRTETSEPFVKAKAACAAFLKWLRSADVESGDDDDDDDEDGAEDEDGDSGSGGPGGRYKAIGVAPTQASSGDLAEESAAHGRRDSNPEDIDIDDL